MKAISLKQPYASWIAMGLKTIETRTWYTKFRGRILIVSSKKPKIFGFPTGKALCIAKIIDCRKMKIEDEHQAKCKMYPKAFSWVLECILPIEPFEVRGKLGIYDVEVNEKNIKFLEDVTFQQILTNNPKEQCKPLIDWFE